MKRIFDIGAAFLTASLLLAGHPLSAERLVMLPIDDRAGLDLEVSLERRIEDEIRRRGWQVVSGAMVEEELAARRIRYVDSLPSEAAREILNRFDAEAYVAATVIAVRTEVIPMVAVSIRVTGRDGGPQWDELVALSSEDALGILDQRPTLGVVPLAERVVERLGSLLPGPGEVRRSVTHHQSPVRLGPPASYLSAAMAEIEPPRRVAILPFKNWSREVQAGTVSAESVRRWLARSGVVEPVEAADLRAALVAERVRDPWRLDAERLAAVGARLGTTLFLQGTVYEWREAGPSGAESAPPTAELNLTLIDALGRRIVWSAHHVRSGDDYRGFLRRGTITNAAALVDRLVAEMTGTLVDGRPVPVPDPGASLAQRLAWR